MASEPVQVRRTPRVALDLELLPLSEQVRTATPPPAARRARAAARSHGRLRRLSRLNMSSGNVSSVSVNANANCSMGSREHRSDRARPDFEVRRHRLRIASRVLKIRTARCTGRRVLQMGMLRLRRRRGVTNGGVPSSVRSAPTAVRSIRRCCRRHRQSLPPRRRKRSWPPRHHPRRPLCPSSPTAISGRRPSDRQ